MLYRELSELVIRKGGLEEHEVELLRSLYVSIDDKEKGSAIQPPPTAMTAPHAE